MQSTGETYEADDIIPADGLYFYDQADADVTTIGEPMRIPRFPPLDLVRRAQATSTWHRTQYEKINPEKIQPFLAYCGIPFTLSTLYYIENLRSK